SRFGLSKERLARHAALDTIPPVKGSLQSALFPHSSPGCGSAHLSAASRWFRVEVTVMLTATGLLCACAGALAATESKLQPDQVSPARQAIAQLTAADTVLKAGQLEAAKREFAKVINLPGAPQHHIWEARERLQEIGRRQAGLVPRDPNASRLTLAHLPSPGLTLHVSPLG